MFWLIKRKIVGKHCESNVFYNENNKYGEKLSNRWLKR